MTNPWSTDTRDLVAATIAAHTQDIKGRRGEDHWGTIGCACGYHVIDVKSAADVLRGMREHGEHVADAVLAALTEAGALLPPDGSVRSEYGHVGDDGLMVSCGRSRSSNPTHVRTIIAWAADGPNDNWPVYYGPWQEVPE